MNTAKKLALFVSDIALLYIALAVTLLIRYGSAAFSTSWQTHIGPFSALFILWLFVWYLADLYRPSTLRTRLGLFTTLVIAALVAAILSMLALYLFSGFFELTPKTNLLIFSLLFLFFGFGARLFLSRLFVSGALGVAVVGSSPLVKNTADFIGKNLHLGYRMIRTFPEFGEKEFRALEEDIRNRNIQLIVLRSTSFNDTGPLSRLYRLLPLEVEIVHFRNFYETVFEKVALDELSEAWFLENIATRKPFFDGTKRVLDMAISAFFLLLLSPFLLLIAILSKLTSHGPVLYPQERIGKNGASFVLYKFRSMRTNHNGPLWTEKNDARITPFGRFLRRTHLDELPQLINILKGDISFAGPRPERIELAEQFKTFPHYEMRHIVKPGLTGWAQINYRPSASLEEAREKLCYDLYYIKNRSLFLDLLILIRTIRYFLLSH